MDPTRRDTAEPRLGLWDAVSLIVGIIIGVGIFETPEKIFAMAPDAWSALGAWALAGVLALVGALCFAELAGAYPRSGGEYVYLTRAYGSLTGFLFAWAQLAVIRPASIGAMAYVFADYAAKLWRLSEFVTFSLAIGAVVLLTVINTLGVTLGKTTQNLLTILKVLGLAAIAVAGFGWGEPRLDAGVTVVGQSDWFAMAMILTLWTYAGWHEAAYIAAEVKNARRNIPLALILGTTAVTFIYLAINAAFLLALGFEAARGKGIPSQVLALAWGETGARALNVLIMISALGAINGMIFTTARIYSEFGADHRLFQPLSRWSRRLGTPFRALLVQGVITILLMFSVSVWLSLRDPDAKIWNVQQGLEQMIYASSAVFWLFFLLTGISVFVLRAKDPDLPRPFRVPGYPVLPLVFCLTCGFMIYASVTTPDNESLIGLLILAAGVLFYFLPKKIKRHPAPSSPQTPDPPVPAQVG